MSRLVVTGGQGRLGRSVVRRLVDAGHDVVSVDLVAGGDDGVEHVRLDCLDHASTTKVFRELNPDQVVHLAAIAVPFSRDGHQIYSINTSLTYNVIDATVAAGARSMLVASSPTLIGYGNPNGWMPRYLPLDEAHPLEPWNGYAASKEAMERLVAMAASQHGDRVTFGVMRPCYVLAPEEWAGALTQQGHTVEDRLLDPALSAPALFNYVDARDVGDFVDGWLGAARGHVANGDVFFVGAPDALAVGATAELLQEFVPGTSSLAAAIEGNGSVFSSTKAEVELGWSAKHVWRSEVETSNPKLLAAGASPAAPEEQAI